MQELLLIHHKRIKLSDSSCDYGYADNYYDYGYDSGYYDNMNYNHSMDDYSNKNHNNMVVDIHNRLLQQVPENNMWLLQEHNLQQPTTQSIEIQFYTFG